MCDFNMGKQRAPVEDIPLGCVQVSCAGKSVPYEESTLNLNESLILREIESSESGRRR